MRRGRRGPRGMAWYGNAGMEKPVKARGMEGSGTVGIVEAWQARSVLVGRGLEGKVTQVRTGLEGMRVGMVRYGTAGMEWVQR